MSEKYGEYELLAPFARGGMAEVFLARRIGVEGFAREVVVKRMLPKLAVDEACVRMFLDEARLTAGLHHPNIAQVLDLGRVDDTYFIAMELVDGPDLKSLFKHAIGTKLLLPAAMCAFIVARVADGLHYAHTKTDPATDDPLRIVHRDVNHANILVSRHGDIKLVDFGVAHAEKRTVVTDVGGLKGKMGYIAPEQCLGEPFDHRSDIFALGVVLHELLTRRPLFYRKSDLETLEHIVYKEAPAPSTQGAVECDAVLDRIVADMLAKKPEDRPADAAEVAGRLDAWVQAVADEPGRTTVKNWVRDHATQLCPTKRIPKSARHSSSSQIKGLTTGEYRRIGGSSLITGTSTRRRLDAVLGGDPLGPSTSRANPLLSRATPSPSVKLPTARGAFFGHEQVLGRIAAQLAGRTRLVTLFGTAGVGKSRVALEHAKRHRKAFPNASVSWCECTEAEGMDGAIAAVAAALAVPLVAAASSAAALEQLGHALASRGRVLVVLDDFDRLIDHTDETLGVWLAMAPDARFVVTSRTLLRSADEAAIEIHPLEVPAKAAKSAQSEAEQLFVARARAVRPDFEPNKAEKKAIAAIVRKLDGIPLAIELAAARVSVLPPDALLARLSHRFDVLRGTGRGPDDKRKALRSAIDWSWTSLSTPEQRALIQASVFRGGFTVASAEAVLQTGDATNADAGPLVLDVIQSLRDRSMLRISGRAGEVRFALFESIREYAVSKAGEAAILRDAEQRHSTYFLQASEEWASKAHTHSGAAARVQLAADVDNIVAVHERALAARPREEATVEIGLRVSLALFPLLIERGPVATLWRLLGESLEAAGTVPVARKWVGMALAAYGEVLARTGQPADGLKMAEEAYRNGHQSGAAILQGQSLIVIALCRWLTDSHDAAMAAAVHARRIARNLGDLALETRCLNIIGCVHFARGDRTASAATLHACVNAARQVGYAHIEAMAQSNVGCIHADTGELERAEECFRAALQACKRTHNRRGVGVNLCELAIVAQERGNDTAAQRYFKRAVDALNGVGDRQRLAYCRFYQGCFELERREHRYAASLLRTAAAFFETAGNDRLWAHATALLGLLHATAGAHEEAARLIHEAGRVAHSQGDPPLMLVVEAMRGATLAIAEVTGERSGQTSGAELARAVLQRAHTPWPADERHPNGRPPPAEWSKELRFAVRLVSRLLGDL